MEIWLSITAVTEEWNVDIGVGSWITGGNLNTARRDLAGIGTSNSSVLGLEEMLKLYGTGLSIQNFTMVHLGQQLMISIKQEIT